MRIPTLPTVLLAAALAMSPAGVAAAQEGAAAAQDAPAAAPALPAIAVVPATPARLTDRVIASGLIGPKERVLVQPQIEGQAVDEVLAEVGDSVTEGQVLARLSPDTLTLTRSQLQASRASAEAAVAQADAQIVEAEANRDEAVRARDRATALNAQGTVSQVAADQAAAAATSAEARLRVARQARVAAEAQIGVIDAQLSDVELRLARTEVKAPVAGEITERGARVGAIASAAAGPMFVIVKDGELELVAEVAEADLLRVAAGQPVRLRLVGHDGVLAGKVWLVEPAVDQATRLGRVRISIEDRAAVRSGMFAEAEIVAAERETLSVPLTAVSGRGADASVLRVVDGVVQRVSVTTGIRDSGLIEVTEGLSAGDLIVAKAASFVREGDRINPVVEAPPAGAASN